MKKFLFAILAVAAMVCVSCTEENAKPSPTGDADADAKALIEYLNARVDSLKTPADFDAFQAELDSLQGVYDKAYTDPEAKAKFDAAGEKYSNELGFKAKFEGKAMEIGLQALKEMVSDPSALEGAVDEAQEAKEEVEGAAKDAAEEVGKAVEDAKKIAEDAKKVADDAKKKADDVQKAANAIGNALR